jgi:hypothetical protein
MAKAARKAALDNGIPWIKRSTPTWPDSWNLFAVVLVYRFVPKINLHNFPFQENPKLVRPRNHDGILPFRLRE